VKYDREIYFAAIFFKKKKKILQLSRLMAPVTAAITDNKTLKPSRMYITQLKLFLGSF